MNCPDIDLLIDYAAGIATPDELHAHLADCPECRKTVAMVRDVSLAFEVREEVPQALIDATMHRIAALPRERSWVGTVTTFLLSLLTFSPLSVLVYSGSGGFAVPVAISAGFAAIATALEPRLVGEG